MPLNLRRYIWIYSVALIILPLFPSAQIQNSQWLFGWGSSLNLLTNPPSSIPGNNMNSTLASASIADENGNLLFYTNGSTVSNRFHNVMANGTGLLGFSAGYQTCLIAKQPGSSSLYYIFTVTDDHDLPGLCYSIVDMNLAAGDGSVTVKNIPVLTDSLHERLTGTRHCNGRDYWIIVNRYRTSIYTAYLLTPSGLSGPVVSSFPPLSSIQYFDGPMKLSPTGNKMALVNIYNNQPVFIYDFNNSTGLLSNSYTLAAPWYIGGCDFSPDGSKVYVCGSNTINNRKLYQWDLCAGNVADIRASVDSFFVPQGLILALQLAPDNKLYVLTSATPTLSIINNPNAAGLAANFTFQNLPVNGTPTGGFPNMITQYQQNYTLFNYSLSPNVSCHAISFTAAPNPTQTCMALPNYSINYISWNFGDPASAALNTSLLQQPLHVYTSSGTFTAMQIFHKNCGSDTVKQIVLVPKPDILVSTGQVSCNIAVPATVTAIGGIGPYSFTWTPSMQTGSIVSLNPGANSVTVFDQGLSCSVNSVITIAPTPPPNFTLSPSSTLTVCKGSTVQITVNGSGTSYTWVPFSGLTAPTGTSSTFNGLSSQTYTVSTELNNCIGSRTVHVNVLELPQPSIKGKTDICLKDSLILTATGGLFFEWSKNGVISNDSVLRQFIHSNLQGGNYELRLIGKNGCGNSTNIQINVIRLPSAELSGPLVGCEPLNGFYSIVNQSARSFVAIDLGGNTGKNQLQHQFYSAGNYTIGTFVQDSVTRCKDKQQYQILVLQKPQADFIFQPQHPVEGLDPIIFTAIPDNNTVTYQWYLLDKVQAKGESYEHLYMKSGLYPVVLVSETANKCRDTIIKTIKVDESWSVYVPNAFTPNDDELNDVFYPVLVNVTKFQFRIYSRWGAVIFESTSPELKWDGSYKGDYCQEGVYNWTLSFTTSRGELKHQAGHVDLKR